MSIFSQVKIQGTTDGGENKNVPVTNEGHLEIAIHDPVLPFGAIHTENLTPVFQTDAVYGINSSEILETTGLVVGTGANSASNIGTNNLFKCSTGTTIYSFSSLQSRRRARYRPGQGVVCMYTALFSAPAANGYQVAGIGSAESGLFFGYNGTSFGVLHSTGGVREIQTMTITTASTATNNYVVTLPNTATVNITATNNANTTRTAYEISQGTFPGWAALARGSTVVFLAASTGNKTGTFSLAQSGAVTPAAASVVETLAGVATTDTWVAQSAWNGDKLDGTGSSGFTLDTTKGNVFRVAFQYLGFGSIEFSAEITSPGSNNATFVVAHTLNFPNTRTAVTLSNPSMPFTMSATSAGSTTDISVSVASFAAFTEGIRKFTGPRMSYFNTTAITSSTSVYTPIFTVRNDLVYTNRANQAIVNILSIGGATKSTNGLTTFYLIRNATLVGNVNFASYSTTSCTYTDSSATSCTFSDNNQVIWSTTTTGDGNFIFQFEDDITLQPGEIITLAVRSVSGTATCIGQLNTREDQ